MSEISRAMAAKQAVIKTLQADIETLRRAAGILGGATGGTTRATPKRRRKMSAATKRALSKQMKAYWAKKKKAQK